MSAPRFSEELWLAVRPIYREILAHPFVTGLVDGTLPKERFRFYTVQDALYLRDFARALNAVAAKSPPGRLEPLPFRTRQGHSGGRAGTP